MKCTNEYEQHYNELGYDWIIGIDEAGRGPIAGPLVVAGVVLPSGYDSDLIYDSKKLSSKKREQAYNIIINDALYFQIDIVDIETIDKLNIYRATQQSMFNIATSNPQIQVVLTDAMPLDNLEMPSEAIIKGDQKSVNIAAGSILAKVTRDHIMEEYDKLYPEYGFKNHKGYPTAQHLAALDKYGVLDIHRKSYGPVAKKLQLHFTFEE